MTKRKTLMLILCVCLLVCPVTAYANILDGTYTVNGVAMPEIPEEVYGRNYILICQNYSNYFLYILGDDDVVTASSSGGNVNVITLTGWGTEGILQCNYSASSGSGWSEPVLYTGSTSTITPPNVYFLESTVDVYTTGDSSTLIFGKNAEIIYKSDDSGGSDEEDTTEETPSEGDNSDDDSSGEDPTEETPSEGDDSEETLSATSFHFVAEPETTIDMLYNLLLMDSIAAFGFLGYRTIKTVFARIRRLRNFKGGDK